MARRLKDWLDAYLEFCKDSEPPQSYHVWAGMSTIAGALQRRVYMRWGRSTIYPNLYVILVGPSGRAKKGTALEFAKPFLHHIRIPTIEGAITREKLIRRMGEAATPIPDPSTSAMVMQCAVTYVSPELSVFLGQGNLKLLADLCDWYDSPSKWVYDTKGQGTDTIEGVCFNLLGATAPDWLPSILPKEAVGGGFTSRCIWVVEEDKGKTVVFPQIDEQLEKILRIDLEKVALLCGEYTFSPEAEETYSKWYTQSDREARRGRTAIQDPKFAGYCDRRATLIKKLSMIIAASEGDSMTISAEQFDRALKLLRLVEQKMARAFAGLGSARYAYATEQLLNFVARHKEVTRSQVLQFFFRDIDEYTFEIVVRTLEKAGAIEVERVTDRTPAEIVLRIKDTLGGRYI